MRGQCVAAALFVFAGLGGTRAQEYPARTVTIIVPFAPGGPADVTGRIVADIFSRHLGQQFVVENVGGAGGTIGSLRAARAAADGYTIISGHMGTHAAAPFFYPNLGYDPEKDFEPIGLIAEQPELLAVRKDFPANNLKEFIAYAKANESKLNMGHAGVGSVSYIGCLLLNSAIGIKPAMVPFTGTAPVMTPFSPARSTTIAIRCWDRCRTCARAPSRRLPSRQRNEARCCRMCPRPTSRACLNSTARRFMHCSLRRALRRRSSTSSRKP
jgi:putative tricarboxylic transport membrane protein